MRPRVVVYNQVSLDGRIVGFDIDVGRYYRRGFRWPSDAILMGSTTATAFGPPESPEQQARVITGVDKVDVYPGFEDLVSEPQPLLVVPDSTGRVRCWVHALAQPWYSSIVVLTSSATPTDYLDYLDRRGIARVSAGADRVDLAAALDRLGAEFGVTSIRTDSGGRLNGALFAAGLVDELAVILSPRIAADPAGRGVVELPGPLPREVRLHLEESEVLDDGALWLRYAVLPPAPE